MGGGGGGGDNDGSGSCFPLVWSLSPRLLSAAPGMLRWYYDQAQQTQVRDTSVESLQLYYHGVVSNVCYSSLMTTRRLRSLLCTHFWN